MSTELTTTVDTLFPILVPGSRAARVHAANLAGSQVYENELASVRMPTGGATNFSYEKPTGESVTTDEIRGILVATAGRGVLWPSREPSGTRPLIVSHDLVTGYKVGDDLGDVSPEVLDKFVDEAGNYDWQAMSNSSEFGYGSAGRGKTVKESQILAILQEGETWPVLLKIGGGSLSVWNKFRKMLPCMPNEAIVSIKLEKTKNFGGQPFSRIKPALVGQLTEEQGLLVEELYTKPLTAMLTRVPGGNSAAGEEAPF